jgi:hypothetical protein
MAGEQAFIPIQGYARIGQSQHNDLSVEVEISALDWVCTRQVTSLGHLEGQKVTTFLAGIEIWVH